MLLLVFLLGIGFKVKEPSSAFNFLCQKYNGLHFISKARHISRRESNFNKFLAEDIKIRFEFLRVFITSINWENVHNSEREWHPFLRHSEDFVW